MQKHRNELLKRDEISLEFGGEKTPSRKELLEKISSQLGIEPSRVSIQKIDQKFGSKQNTVLVHAYDSKEGLERTELPQILFRNRGEKRKPAKKEPKSQSKKK